MFSGGMACVCWETNCSSRKMPISLEEQQVPQGKCTCFPGSNKFPGEDECVPWETRAIPPRTCYSLGNLLFPKKQVQFPRGTFFPLGNTCNPLGTCCSLWKICIFPRELVVSWQKKNWKKEKKISFFFIKYLQKQNMDCENPHSS